MRRDDFKPTIHSRICAKHFVTTDYHPFSIYLKNTAIQSVSQSHVQRVMMQQSREIKMLMLLIIVLFRSKIRVG